MIRQSLISRQLVLHALTYVSKHTSWSTPYPLNCLGHIKERNLKSQRIGGPSKLSKSRIFIATFLHWSLRSRNYNKSLERKIELNHKTSQKEQHLDNHISLNLARVNARKHQVVWSTTFIKIIAITIKRFKHSLSTVKKVIKNGTNSQPKKNDKKKSAKTKIPNWSNVPTTVIREAHIDVELPHEAREVTVLEVLWKQ